MAEVEGSEAGEVKGEVMERVVMGWPEVVGVVCAWCRLVDSLGSMFHSICGADGEGAASRQSEVRGSRQHRMWCGRVLSAISASGSMILGHILWRH